MKKILSALVTASFLFVFFAQTTFAQSCNYGSTQARVQNNINTPWSQTIQVGCDRGFNVGSFHNGTGQFANDTKINIVGPNGAGGDINTQVSNGQRVFVPSTGTYFVFVSTNGNYSGGCYDVATVNVVCNPAPQPPSTPKPQPTNKPSGSCSYGSTQARVQKDTNDAWKKDMTLNCGERFNVGSFHDNSGQFAGDTKLRVTGPSVFFGLMKLNHDFSNGQSIKATFPGTYRLKVTTNGQSGSACGEVATVKVSCSSWVWWQ